MNRANSGGDSSGSAVNASMVLVLLEADKRPSREVLLPHYDRLGSPVSNPGFLLDLEDLLRSMPEPEVSAAVLILQGESQIGIQRKLKVGWRVVQRARKLLQEGMREWTQS